ncbi:MAG: small multi-drug export protein [Bacillota bacterium]
MDIPRELMIVWTASLPVLELRAAIPLAIKMGIHPVEALVLGIIGNILPIPAVLWLLEPVTAALRRWRISRKGIEWVLRHSRAKSETIRRYGFLGLIALVSVPLPSTGAWTGAIAASLLGLKFWSSLLAITIGTTIAGAIVTGLTVLGTGL